MKNAILGAAIIILGIFLLIMFMAIPDAGATLYDNGELVPVDPLLPWAEWCSVPPADGPQEVTFGKNVWVLENREEWKNITKGFDFMHWNDSIFYRYLDNSRFMFYTFETGVTRYPPHPTATPIPPSVVMLFTGLVGLAGFRRKAK